jgi:hypothetical protein
MMRQRLARAAGAPLLAFLLSACAPKPPALPTGAGLPFPEFPSAYADATNECSGTRTITAAIALSGRAGKTKLRGRIDAGFSAPAELRLEGVHPFGKPVFILVARGEQATLVLPRDDRVLRNARPAAIVEALAGVALSPLEMRWAVAGCGLGPVTPSGGTAYAKGWVAMSAGETTTYVRQIEGRWRIVAVSRGPLIVSYGDYAGGRPATVRLRTTPESGGAAADLTLRLSQVETNVTLARDVFDVEVPRDAVPLTLEELRRAGPLGR